jgi:hypothetical protein
LAEWPDGVSSKRALKVDLQTQLQQRDGCAWESVITFYYRGRFGSPTEHAAVLGDHCAYTAPWRIDGHDRWRFGALTGDYNGIHQWDWYARRFGFAAAFAHPQRVAAQCLARLHPSNSIPRTLDLWIKGLVYFGSEVVQTLSTLADDRGSRC